MAGKTIKKNEVIEDNIFSNLKLSAEQALGAVVALESSLEAISATAKTMKGAIPKGAPVDSKGVAELNAQQQKANELAKSRMEIDKQLVKEKLKLQEANKQIVANLREEILLEQKGLGTLERIKVESNQLRKEREKLNLSTAEGSKRLKEINVVLDKNNAIVRESADNLKRQTLNVGNYEGAIKPLKTQLREMTMALQNMDEAHPDFNRMVAEAGQLRDKISDTKAVIEATAGSGVENMAKGLAGVGSIGVQAFQGIEGGMALFGVESESVMKTLVKLQALAALSDSLKGLGALGDTMTQIKASFAAAATQLGIFTAAKEVDTVVTVGETAATGGATVATNTLGKAMLSLPIVALIAGIAALAAGLVYLATKSGGVAESIGKGFKAAHKAVMDFNKELSRIGDIQDKQTETILANLDREARRRIAMGEDEIKVQKEINIRKIEQLKIGIAQDRSSVKQLEAEIAKLKVYEIQTKTLIAQQITLAQMDYANSLTDMGRSVAGKKIFDLAKQYNELEKSTKKTLFETNKLLYAKTAEIVNAKDAVVELELSQLELDKTERENAQKAAEDRKKQAADKIKDAKKLKAELDKIDREYEDEARKRREAAEDEAEKRAEFALDQKRKEKEALDAIDLQIEKDAEAKRLEAEIADEKKQEAALADKLKKEEEALQKRYEMARNFTDASNAYAQKALDEKLAMLDKEIEASQKQRSTLEDLANNGNIQAQQSLAEQYKIEAEAARKKAELEKRKQEFAIISQTINSYLQARASGENVGQALASAGGDAAVLQSLTAMLPTFLEGTENTGKVSNPLDANGGRLAVIHDEERILTKEHNAIIGNMTNAELVTRVQLSRFKDTTADAAPSGWDNAAIIAELQGVKEAIKAQPIQNLEVGRITQKTMEIVHTIKKGNTNTSNTFRVS